MSASLMWEFTALPLGVKLSITTKPISHMLQTLEWDIEPPMEAISVIPFDKLYGHDTMIVHGVARS